MSEVISFRLNKSNPREAQATEILEAWCSKGYSVRHVMTEALQKLGDPGLETAEENSIPDLNAVLIQINKLLEIIGNGEYPLYPKHVENNIQTDLEEDFISSVKKAIKPGIKVEKIQSTM